MNLNKIRVLFVGLLPLGEDIGSAIHFRELASALLTKGVTPTLLVRRSPRSWDNPLIRVIKVPIIERRFLRQFAWNLVGIPMAILAIKRYNLDLIYSRMDPGDVVALVVSKLTRRPLFFEVNGFPTEDLRLYRAANRLLLFLSKTWEQILFQIADMVVAAPGYAKFVQKNYKIPNEKMCVVPLGVNLKLFHPMNREACIHSLQLERKVRYIVWIGTITDHQALDTVVNATPIILRRFANIRFLVVGNGPSLPLLKSHCINLGVERQFVFAGRISYSQVATYIGTASVCLGTFPSERGSRGSISALKTRCYLACGRPIVLTEMEEMAELITERRAGISIPPDDPKALASAVCHILDLDDVAWLEMGKQAACIAHPEYGWQKVAEKIRQCMQAIIT